MDERQPDSFEISDKDQARRERLGRTARASERNNNPKYSKFVRWARLILPIIALVIAGIVFTWGHMRPEGIVPKPSAPEITTKSIGKNELRDARFESRDEKKQPYTITAKRAFQDQNDDSLVLLDEPLADMLLNSGKWVALKARKGTFAQDTQKLVLEDQVRLFHDDGYQMETQRLNIDIENNTAMSEEKIYAQGPKGTLESMGFEGDAQLDYIKFFGPAKLVLLRSVSNNEVDILP